MASPTPQRTVSPTDPLLAEGVTGAGIEYELVLHPGSPLCVELQQTNGDGSLLLCDEDSEQDFNGDQRLRYVVGGLNPEQVPKFVIGATAADVARVVINLSGTESPEVPTVESSAVPGRRFFVVMLDPHPAQEILAIRGLDSQGRTVAGFSLGPPEEAPSPLPTG